VLPTGSKSEAKHKMTKLLHKSGIFTCTIIQWEILVKKNKKKKCLALENVMGDQIFV
jgi:hypothetical protein